MTTSQWVRILTEDGLTIQAAETRPYIPCRPEIQGPSSNWSLSWRLCWLKSLDSELVSFNFKLLQGLLVTKERLNHLNAATSSAKCSHCNDQVNEDLQHALLTCSYNNGVGQTLLTATQNLIPDVSPEHLLRLELTNLPEEQEISVMIFISTFLMEIWNKRFKKARITLYDIRATLEARCLLLRETRYSHQISTLSDMLNQI